MAVKKQHGTLFFGRRVLNNNTVPICSIMLEMRADASLRRHAPRCRS